MDFAISDELYTPKELEEILKLSAGTVYHLLKTGKIASILVGNGTKRSRRRVTKSALEEYLSSGEKENGQQS